MCSEMSEDNKLVELYELDDCVQWISNNNYRSTSLQFSEDCLKDSSSIALLLKKRTNADFYISYSTTCSVDYLSILHLNETTIDSIIYFGTVCLTESKFSESLPVLYVFGQRYKSEQTLNFIASSISEIQPNNAIILYDTSCALIALEFHQKFCSTDDFKGKVSIAKLNSISEKWNFTKSADNIIEVLSEEHKQSGHRLGPFYLSQDLVNYDLFVYLGQSVPLELKLNCGPTLEIQLNNRSKQMIDPHKELRKRVALIEKFKQDMCQTVGLVFTNPVSNNINQLFTESKKLCRKMKKNVYFISLMLTIDEYKLGNFAELNSFVVVNSCFCWSPLRSIDFCLPVLNYTEFKIASGLALTYGGVHWNQSSDLELSDSDETQMDALNNQLIQTQLFDRNKWFGLEVNAGDREASAVKSGQKGIASAYDNETLF